MTTNEDRRLEKENRGRMKAPYVTERREGTITMEEMDAAIDKMKVRKAGGT